MFPRRVRLAPGFFCSLAVSISITEEFFNHGNRPPPPPIRLQDTLALIGRILIGYLFIPAGIGKLMGFGGTVGYITSAGLPLPEVAAAIAIVIELGFGIALLLGFKTRWTAHRDGDLHRGHGAVLPQVLVGARRDENDAADQLQQEHGDRRWLVGDCRLRRRPLQHRQALIHR
jgi:hypothetical protein